MSFLSNPAIDAPAIDAVAVTKSDDTLLKVTRALYVGGKGDVAVTMFSGAVVVFKDASGILPIKVIKVMATNTTATDIVALY